MDIDDIYLPHELIEHIVSYTPIGSCLDICTYIREIEEKRIKDMDISSINYMSLENQIKISRYISISDIDLKNNIYIGYMIYSLCMKNNVFDYNTAIEYLNGIHMSCVPVLRSICKMCMRIDDITTLKTILNNKHIDVEQLSQYYTEGNDTNAYVLSSITRHQVKQLGIQTFMMVIYMICIISITCICILLLRENVFRLFMIICLILCVLYLVRLYNSKNGYTRYIEIGNYYW